VEQPAPKGDVPGEWYSPTQPPAYELADVTMDDLIDFTPKIHDDAVKLVSQYQIGPIFTPPVVSKIEGPLATLTDSQDATNWEGGSYDPVNHIVYVFSTGTIGAVGLVPSAQPGRLHLWPTSRAARRQELARTRGRICTWTATSRGRRRPAGRWAADL
jgi:quinoprotein glucose dehydrogenase